MVAIVDRLFGRFEVHLGSLLAASAIGVYVLVVVGATTSLLDAASACSTWPTCNGSLLPGSDPMAVLNWAHRVLGLLVGLLLIGTLGTAWASAGKRVRYVVTVAALLYPVQTILGARIALGGVTQPLAAVHLVVAIGIFTGILVGLLWYLERATVGPKTESAVSTVDVDPSGVPEASQYKTPEPGQSSTPEAGQSQTPEATRSGTEYSRVDLLGAYVELTKPRLWWLLSLVAVAAMALAAGPALSFWNVAATISGGVLAIGASGTFNNVLEIDRDRRMDRTADRPLVDGTIPPSRAVAFGLALSVSSVFVFVLFVNVLAAALGLLAILFYSVVYTLLLKPHTDRNIVIGGAVGGFPALIGWAAVTNSIELPAVVLGTIVFLWTPAHFYNLALAYKEDYARADFPMLPISRNEAVTRRHIFLYLLATMAAAVALGTIRPLGWTYAVASIAVGALFLWAVIRLFRERTETAAFKTFHAANAYLGVLLLAIVVDAVILT